MSSGDADSSRLLNPFGGGHYETIKTCLGSNRVELHTVKCIGKNVKTMTDDR